jgi:hypothetical protein
MKKPKTDLDLSTKKNLMSQFLRELLDLYTQIQEINHDIRISAKEISNYSLLDVTLEDLQCIKNEMIKMDQQQKELVSAYRTKKQSIDSLILSLKKKETDEVKFYVTHYIDHNLNTSQNEETKNTTDLFLGLKCNVIRALERQQYQQAASLPSLNTPTKNKKTLLQKIITTTKNLFPGNWKGLFASGKQDKNRDELTSPNYTINHKEQANAQKIADAKEKELLAPQELQLEKLENTIAVLQPTTLPKRHKSLPPIPPPKAYPKKRQPLQPEVKTQKEKQNTQPIRPSKELPKIPPTLPKNTLDAVKIRQQSYINGAKLLINNSDLPPNTKELLLIIVEAASKVDIQKSMETISSKISDPRVALNSWLHAMTDMLNQSDAAQKEKWQVKWDELMTAEQISLWEKGSQSFTIKTTSPDGKYQYEQTSEPLQELTPEQIKECLRVFSTFNILNKQPLWFYELPQFAQNYIKTKWHAFHSIITKKLETSPWPTFDVVVNNLIADPKFIADFNQQYKSIPTTFRSIPGIANFGCATVNIKHIVNANANNTADTANTATTVTSSVSLFSSTPMPISLKKHPKESLRLAKQNVKQLITSAARKIIATNPTPQQTKITLPILIQSLLSAHPFNRKIGNDKFMLDVKEEAIVAVIDEYAAKPLTLAVDGIDYVVDLQVLQSNHALNEFRVLNKLGKLIYGENTTGKYNAECSASLINLACKKLNIALHIAPLRPITAKDMREKNNNALQTIKEHVNNKINDATADEKILSIALKTYIEISENGGYDNEDGDRNLFHAALELFITGKVDGLGESACKSGKDRRGAVEAFKNAILAYIAIYGNMPPLYGDKMRSADRQKFLEIVVTFFKSGFVQTIANENAPGAAGLKSMTGPKIIKTIIPGILPPDLTKELEAHSNLKEEGKISKINKPKEKNHYLNKLVQACKNDLTEKVQQECPCQRHLPWL